MKYNLPCKIDYRSFCLALDLASGDIGMGTSPQTEREGRYFLLRRKDGSPIGLIWPYGVGGYRDKIKSDDQDVYIIEALPHWETAIPEGNWIENQNAAKADIEKYMRVVLEHCKALV